MLVMFRKFTLYIFLTSICFGQLRSELPVRTLPVNIHGVSHTRNMSIFDSNRLSISNSFGMTMSTNGNQSISLGSFNTQLSYLFSDKVRLSSQFSLMSPMGGINPYSQNGLNGAKLYYNTSIDYKPMENMIVKFSMNNYPRYYRNSFSRYLYTK
ncbi:MAG: hypothetical protein VXX38_05945 [Candidatus Neomarinimicrobiota bacterium]|nr:hypothetical protein [Candidatus Neomarinimicrobiota bacterium]